jgi:hypothetical protein
MLPGVEMAKPEIRIFPHNQEEEFRSIDQLTSWLMTSLPARGGVYHLKSKDAVKDLPPGSLVLFRYGHVIVGEGIVRMDKELGPFRGRTLSGEETEYEAKVTFAPASIRLYAPPLPVEFLQQTMRAAGVDKDIITSAVVKVRLEDWSIYAAILAEVVSQGTFIQ